MPKHEVKLTFYWITCEGTLSCNEISLVYVLLQNKKTSKIYTKNVAWNLVSDCFLFLKNITYKGYLGTSPSCFCEVVFNSL